MRTTCILLLLSFALLLSINSFAQDKYSLKLFNKAKSLQNKKEYFSANIIYNELVDQYPHYPLFYKERSINLSTLGKKDESLADLKTASSLIENKKCNCDLNDFYDQETKNHYKCTTGMLAGIYYMLYREYKNREQYDSTLIYISKAVGLFYNSNGQMINYAKDPLLVRSPAKYHSYRADVYFELKNFREALNDELKVRELGKQSSDNLFSIYYVLGEYDKALNYLKRSIFSHYDTNNGKFTSPGDRHNATSLFCGYIATYIAQRHFDSAYSLIFSYTKRGYNPETGEFNTRILFGENEIYAKGESRSICERMDTTQLIYSFLNFYECFLKDANEKKYESCLSSLDRFYQKFQNKLIRPYEYKGGVYGMDPFLFESSFFSLKGFLLTKLGRSEEAKEFYRKAIVITPDCKEAIQELKAID